jgi:hypothetical protein
VLFEPELTFRGLPAAGFAAFAIRERQARRRAIVDAFHPALEALGADLVARLARGTPPLRWYLPRLDWPRGYQPFCTWLALSREGQGYQRAAQLNLGVHADHVAARLGWDAAADAFGRFEFLARHSDLGSALVEAAGAARLRFRVYAAAPWPRGSELVLETADDLAASFNATRRRGVWWELGRRHDLPGALDLVTGPALAREALEVFSALLPLCDRLRGASGAG